LASALRRFAAIVARFSRLDQAKNGRTIWRLGDGRVYERPRPVLVSLNLDGPDEDRLRSTLDEGVGDPAADCDPIVNGYSVTEIARATGTTRSWVLTRLDGLREELERPG
jgi:DNA invertase Pin-like site-specific DNA recombinase